jgi:Glycosyl hydrolases family 16
MAGRALAHPESVPAGLPASDGTAHIDSVIAPDGTAHVTSQELDCVTVTGEPAPGRTLWLVSRIEPRPVPPQQPYKLFFAIAALSNPQPGQYSVRYGRGCSAAPPGSVHVLMVVSADLQQNRALWRNYNENHTGNCAKGVTYDGSRRARTGSIVSNQLAVTDGPGHQVTLSARSAPFTDWGKPVFTDDFDGTTLNRKWSVYNDPTATGNDPRRTTASVKVRNGRLELIGHYQKPYGYVSGGISDNTNQTYGRWVVRFRADAGAGYAPVVLLWPKGHWPNDGEIDMAEITSAQRRGGNEFLHLGAKNRHIGHPFPPSTDFTRWHILAVNWLPGHITFSLDGQPLWTVNRGHGSRNYIPRTPFHIALQNDQGCDDGCTVNRHTPRRVIMYVDWVRIYAAPPG